MCDHISIEKNSTIFFTTFQDNFVVFGSVDRGMMIQDRRAHQLNTAIIAFSNQTHARFDQKDYLIHKLLIKVQVRQMRCGFFLFVQLFTFIFLLLHLNVSLFFSPQTILVRFSQFTHLSFVLLHDCFDLFFKFAFRIIGNYTKFESVKYRNCCRSYPADVLCC